MSTSSITGAASQTGVAAPSTPQVSPAPYTGPKTLSIGGVNYNVTQNQGVYGIYDGPDFFPLIPKADMTAGAGQYAGGMPTPISLSPTLGPLFANNPNVASNAGMYTLGNSSFNGGLSVDYTNKGGGQTQAQYGLQGDYYTPTSFTGIGGPGGWIQKNPMDALSLAAAAVMTGGVAGAFGGAGAGAGATGTGAAAPAAMDASAQAALEQGATDAATSYAAGGSTLPSMDPALQASLDSGITGATGTLGPSTGGSSLLDNLNTARKGYNAANTASKLLGNGSGKVTTGTTPQSGLGSGISSALDLVGGSNGLATAGLLGAAGLAASKTQGDAATYANDYKKIAGTVQPLMNQELQSAQSGQLMPWQQASVDRMVQQERAQSQQYLANAGIGDSQGNAQSTASLDLNRQIDTNALIQSGQMVQQNYTNFMKTFGEYGTYMDKSIQAQIQGDQEVMKLWDNVLGGLAKSMMSGGKSTSSGTNPISAAASAIKKALSGLTGSSSSSNAPIDPLTGNPTDLYSVPSTGAAGSIDTLTGSMPDTGATVADNTGSIDTLIGSMPDTGSSVTDWFCDRRLKKDIVHFGIDSSTGLNIYLFRYVWDKDSEAPRIGPMADEVMEKFPWAVTVDDNGFYRISADMGAGHG
jgi:hypothetical protein